MTSAWLLIKNTLVKNKSLVVSIELCICLCFIFVLYAASFFIKVSILNSDGTYVINVNTIYGEVKKSVENFPADRAASLTLILDNSTVIYKINSDFPVQKGRKPTVANEIFSSNYEDSTHINEEITIAGRTYLLVGWSPFLNADYLLSEDALTDDTVIRKIAVTSNQSVASRDFGKLIKAGFKEYDISFPEKSGLSELIGSTGILVPIALTVVLILASLVLTIKFLFNKLSASARVYLLCGYSRRKMILILTDTAVMLLAMPIIIGEIIYLPIESFALNSLTGASLSVRYYLTFVNHTLVILSFILLTTALLLPYIERLSSRKVMVGKDA